MPLRLTLPGESSPLTIDAVICDMDGLLIDSEGLSTEAWRVTLARYGQTLRDADIAAMFGLRIDEDAELLIARYHLPASVTELVDQKSAALRDLMRDALRPMPGAVALVRWLTAEAIPHALATSGLGDYAAECLRLVGLADAFPVRVSGEQVAHGKPAPDIFLEAARRLGIAPEACLVLEDAPHGVAAALAAGMRVIAIPNEHTKDLAFPPGAAFAPSLTHVTAWLQQGLADVRH